MTEAEAFALADAHLRKALDAFAHDLYPASLAKTFGQEGKPRLLAAKLLEDEARWTAYLTAVEERVDLLQRHKEEHWDLLRRARADNQDMAGYAPPDEQELLDLLPREYVELLGKPGGASMPPEKPVAAPVRAVETGPPAETRAVAEPAVEPESGGSPDRETALPAAGRPRSLAVAAVSLVGALLVGAAAGYLVRGLKAPAAPVAPAPVPSRAEVPSRPREAWVALILNGKPRGADTCEAAGRVTIRYVRDQWSVTVHVTSVEEPKPEPKPRPKAKAAPKPKPGPKPKDGFPTGWEL